MLVAKTVCKVTAWLRNPRRLEAGTVLNLHAKSESVALVSLGHHLFTLNSAVVDVYDAPDRPDTEIPISEEALTNIFGFYLEGDSMELKAVFVGGRYDRKVMSLKELESVGNGKLSPDCSDYRKRGCLCQREELDNKPLVEGYCGPMWDAGNLRYETWEVYQALSR